MSAKTGDAFMDTLILIWDIFRYGWPLMIVALLMIWKIRWKHWPLEVLVIEKRGSNLIGYKDRAGKYYDKYTQITGYRFKTTKDTCPVVNFEWVLHYSPKQTNFFERLTNLLRPTAGLIVFFKYGTKQYKPVEIMVDGKKKRVYKEVKGKDGKPVFEYRYEQVDPRDKLKMLNFDVVDWDNMNFMVQEQRASAERRRKAGEWLKTILIPIIMIAATALVCIIMIKFSYDYAISMRGGNQVQETPSDSNAKPNFLDNVIPKG